MDLTMSVYTEATRIMKEVKKNPNSFNRDQIAVIAKMLDIQ